METKNKTNTTKILASMTEEEKKKLRSQRFNLVNENVNTIQSIEVISSRNQTIEREMKRSNERLKRFGTFKEEDKLKMRKERFGTFKEHEKLKIRRERFGPTSEKQEFVDKLESRKERFKVI